jgi:pyruvate dehydrogenase (quinone)
MLGINALPTIAAHWKRWRDPRLVILVLHNNDLNMVSWEQRVTEGDPKFPASQDLPAFQYAAYAKLLGLHGILVDRPEHVAAAWDEALRADRPVVLEAITDPDVPPLPPHVTAAQAKHYMKALLNGDPDAAQIVMASAREVWDGLAAHAD